VNDRIAETFTGMGVDPASGVKLQAVLRRAGLSAPRLTLGAPLGGADAIEDLDHLRGETWRLVFPIAEQLGLVTDELADLDTLLPRSRPETGTNAFRLPASRKRVTRTSGRRHGRSRFGRDKPRRPNHQA
jgi:hypothetical protein